MACVDRGSEDALNAFVAEAPIPRRAILSFVSRFARTLQRGSRVLDAGAGRAPFRTLFGHCEYMSQDWTHSLHDFQPDIVGDLQRGLSVPAGSFDAVLCTEVLEHVGDVRGVLAELHRVLRPGGLLAVTVPFVGPLHEEPHDHRRFTNHGLKTLLDDSGFDTLTIDPLTGWFGTMAQMIREYSAATRRVGQPPSLGERVTGRLTFSSSELIARVAESLDRRVDHRKALPLGWSALATSSG